MIERGANWSYEFCYEVPENHAISRTRHAVRRI